MFKKIIGMVMALVIMMACGIQAYAANDDSAAEYNNKLISKVLRDADAEENNNGIVDVRKPEDAIITTCKESYTISGETSLKNVRVYLAKYDEDKAAYVPFENNDGESSWRIGTYGKFAKGILLSKGANKLKIVATIVSDSEKLTEDDIQVSKYTITFFEKSIADKFIKGIQDGISEFRQVLDSWKDNIK